MSDLIRAYKRTGDRRYLREFYGAESYVRLYGATKLKWVAKFGILARQMALERGQDVLDVGAARQHFRPYVEASGASYTSVDLSAGFEPDYVCDAESLDGVPPDSFDWVVLSDVLEHLPRPDLALRAAARTARRLLTVVPNWYHLDRVGWLPRDPGDRHITRMTPRRWLRLHGEAGWRVDHFRGFYYVPSIAFRPWYPLQLFDGLMRKSPLHLVTRPIDRYLAHLPILRVSAQELVIVSTRTG